MSAVLQVDTLASGEMDYGHFREQLRALGGRPAIVNVNVGTTVKGAVDDVDQVIAALEEAGYAQERFYIHVDGALFGMMVRARPHACMHACAPASPCMPACMRTRVPCTAP